MNKAYDVKPKSGGDLPYDFHGDGNIDLVVGRLKDKSGVQNVTPSDLLSDFDLGKMPKCLLESTCVFACMSLNDDHTT